MSELPQGVALVQIYRVVASDNLKLSHDAELSFTNASWEEKKRITMYLGGTWRTYYELKTLDAGFIVYGRIYHPTPTNMTETYCNNNSTNSLVYVGFTGDTNGLIGVGQPLRLNCYVAIGGTTGYVQNFRTSGDLYSDYGVNT